MPRNEPLFPANQINDQTIVTPGKMRQLDQRASENLDVVNGGTWTPEEKIWIGGAGVVLNNSCWQQATVETGRDAVGLILGAGRYPLRLSSVAQKKTVTAPIFDVTCQTTIGVPAAFGVPAEQGRPLRAKTIIIGTFVDGSGITQNIYALRGFQRVRAPSGLQCVSEGQQFEPLLIPLPQLRIHNGAVITKLRVSMRFARKPIAAELLNASTVYARLIRYPIADDVAGNVSLPPSLTNDFDLYIIPPFQAATPYLVGDVVIPSPANIGAPPRQYRCIAAGLSGSSSGGWSDTLCDVVISNFAHFLVEPRPPSDAGVGNFQDKHHYATLPYATSLDDTASAQFQNGLPFDLELTPNQNTQIDTDNYAYAVEIISPGSPHPIFHSLSWDLDFIDSMMEP